MWLILCNLHSCIQDIKKKQILSEKQLSSQGAIIVEKIGTHIMKYILQRAFIR